MELAREFQAKQRSKLKHLHGGGIFVNSENQVTIRFPDSWVFKVIARSLLLAFVIVTFPWFGSTIIRGPSNFDGFVSGTRTDSINVKLLSLLFRDLANEGLLKRGDRTLFVSLGNEEAIDRSSQILDDNEMDLITGSDYERQSSIPDETVDFVFTSGFHASEFVDRTLKIGGVAAVLLSEDPSKAIHKPSNYKIVYLRRFHSTIVAMRKTGPGNVSMNSSSSTKRRLCALTSEAKKAALEGLEDVLLEPPRTSSGKSNKYLKRTKYLPDLTGDSLEGYPRHVFIEVGLPDKMGGGGTGWFVQNYPRRNRDFEMYKIDTVAEEESGKEVPRIGMSDWLRRNVREEEYVVMKAEAEVVEEMVKTKTICLVDELFLECKHQGQGGKKNKSRRAYWECLALYGRLRDEGVAVHQWWA